MSLSRLLFIKEKREQGLTFQEVGQLLDPPISRQRVHQICKVHGIPSPIRMKREAPPCPLCGNPIKNYHTSITCSRTCGVVYRRNKLLERTHKICALCNKTKKVSKFYVHSETQLPESYCKSCRNNKLYKSKK